VSPIDSVSVIELDIAQAGLLQALFEDNAEYFHAIQSAPASATEAYDELTEELPSGWSFTRQYRLGWQDQSGALRAMANVTSDLLAPGVWHIGLFMLAKARQGSGDAQSLYRSLEKWAHAQGAHWLRLGVVLGNERAERFWRASGFVECRKREGVEMGGQINTIRVMVKPLRGGMLADYLQSVPRDRPIS
jgi:GNAT superfamily N-acetyltransferase